MVAKYDYHTSIKMVRVC